MIVDFLKCLSRVSHVGRESNKLHIMKLTCETPCTQVNVLLPAPHNGCCELRRRGKGEKNILVKCL